jgi:hypothetical protein
VLAIPAASVYVPSDFSFIGIVGGRNSPRRAGDPSARGVRRRDGWSRHTDKRPSLAGSHDASQSLASRLARSMSSPYPDRRVSGLPDQNDLTTWTSPTPRLVIATIGVDPATDAQNCVAPMSRGVRSLRVFVTFRRGVSMVRARVAWPRAQSSPVPNRARWWSLSLDLRCVCGCAMFRFPTEPLGVGGP